MIDYNLFTLKLFIFPMYKYILTLYYQLQRQHQNSWRAFVHTLAVWQYYTVCIVLYLTHLSISDSPVCALIGGSLPLILLDLMINIPG